MSGSHRRVIPREELSEFQRWQFNSLLDQPAAIVESDLVEEAPLEPPPEPVSLSPEPASEIVSDELASSMPYPTLDEIEAIQQQAHEEGLQAGLLEGRAQAAAELQQMQTLLAGLSQTLQDSEAQLAESVLDLAILVARQIICDELSSDPKKLLAPIRDALAVMPTATHPARLSLAPSDFAVLQPPLALELPADIWRIQVDESLASGSCKIETPATHLAFSLASRWEGYLRVLQRSHRSDLAWDKYPGDMPVDSQDNSDLNPPDLVAE